MLKDPKLTDQALVRRLYLLTFNRPPTAAETAEAKAIFAEAPEPGRRRPGPVLGAAQFQGVLVQSLTRCDHEIQPKPAAETIVRNRWRPCECVAE